MHVLIHYSIKPQLAFNPHYQSCERRAVKEWMSKCLPGEEGRAEWKMKDCRDIGGSGQFLITKVLISVAKGFIEIRIACVGWKEEGGGSEWSRRAIFCTCRDEGGQIQGGRSSRGRKPPTTNTLTHTHSGQRDGQLREPVWAAQRTAPLLWTGCHSVSIFGLHISFALLFVLLHDSFPP